MPGPGAFSPPRPGFQACGLLRAALWTALFAVCLLAFSPCPAPAAPAVEGGRLVLVHAGDAPPYCFRDADGQPAGLLVDFWRLFGRKAGLEVELRLAPDALKQVEDGRADAHAGLVPAPGQEDRLLFSRPLLDLGIGLFAERMAVDGGTAGQPLHLDSENLTAGLLANDPASAFLAASFPKLRQRTYPDLPSLAAALALGQVRVAAGPLLLLRHHLDRLGGENRFTLLRSFPGPRLRAVLRHGDAALLARVNAGLERIGPDETAALEARWQARIWRFPAWAAALGTAGLGLGMGLMFFLRARRLRARAEAQIRETDLLRDNLMAEMARHKKTQDLFAAAIEQSPSGIIIAFPGGELPPVLNRQAMSLLKLKEPPPLGRSEHDRSWTLFTPAGRLVPREELPLERVLNRGETLHNMEYRGVLSDGTERWVLLNAAPVLGQDGARRAGVVVFQDITASRQAERDLARFKFLLDAGVEEVYLVRPDGRLAYVNEAVARSLGYPTGELVGRPLHDIDPSFQPEGLARLMRSVREGPLTFETTQRTRSGLRPIKEIKTFYMRFGEEEFVCGFGQDITERKRMQEELERTRALFAAALEQTLTGIAVADSATGRIITANPVAVELMGLTPELQATLTLGDRPPGCEVVRGNGVSMPPGEGPLNLAARQGVTTRDLELRFLRPGEPDRWVLVSAAPVRSADGALMAGVLALTDITARKQMESQLLFKAQHDALTGLPNRGLCLERIQETLERALRGNTLFAVAFMDLDRFKMLNDSLGHSFGDRVLAEAARRLVLCLGGRGTVSRFGGDEFVLIVEEPGSAEDAQALIRQALETLRQPMRVEGQEVRLTASVGVVVGPTADSPRAESILQNADLAMHRAKDSGRDRIRLFHPGMLRRALELLALDADMRRGLEQDEFVVFYQPVMRMDGGEMLGMEALVRWKSPTRGLVTPHAFIPHAEESGLIVPLGEQVLRQACAAMADWRARFPAARGLSLAVNLSVRQFMQPDIVESVRQVLVQTGLPPARLKLELTESTLMADPEGALSAMRRLKALGVSLAIDDFGTGYSSLAYLQRFPVDILKIDRSFVRDLPRGDPDSLALVRAITALADSLRMSVVAEGVESREQLDILARLGCGAVQGFLFHPPLPEAEMAALLGPARKPGAD